MSDHLGGESSLEVVDPVVEPVGGLAGHIGPAIRSTR
jgi:hypothetical protein